MVCTTANLFLPQTLGGNVVLPFDVLHNHRQPFEETLTELAPGLHPTNMIQLVHFICAPTALLLAANSALISLDLIYDTTRRTQVDQIETIIEIQCFLKTKCVTKSQFPHLQPQVD